MKIVFITILFVIVSALLQHITHEIFHIVVGKLVGLSLVSVKWFTFHGGTKVTFKGEEEIISCNNGSIPKEWIIENLAGIIGTTVMSYIFVIIYLILPTGYVKLLFWVLLRYCYKLLMLIFSELLLKKTKNKLIII